MSSFAVAEDKPAGVESAEIPSSTPPEIQIDHEFIKEDVPKAAILTLTNTFVTVTIVRTPYARVQLRVQYTPSYPAEPPIVELSSPTLPPPLLRTKEKECIELAKKHLGEPQVRFIYEHIYQFIQTNLFIPCWKEMKRVVTLCEGRAQLGADEKTGVLHMRLVDGEYRQAIKLTVPPMYPEEGVQIEFTTSTFPSNMQFMFRCQAEEIVRRCVSGSSPEIALSGSNPIELPALTPQGAAGKTKNGTGPAGKKNPTAGVKLTTDGISNLKHDVNVLKQMSDLRVATQTSHKYQYSVHGNAERREARKDLRRLAKTESEADAALEKKMREEEQREMKALMSAKVSDIAQPSLYAAASFLIDGYALRLAKERCQACDKPVLPTNPDSDALRNPHSIHRPMRTYCGHWLHYRCLDQWLTTPPFVRQCPVCDRRIWHPDWPADHRLLEKAWMKKEERKREVSDVSDFLALGDAFATDQAKAGQF